MGAAEGIIAPPPMDDAPIAPPPPPIIETPLPDGPDPNAMELVKPDVEIWRGDSEWPQIPARFSDRLDTAYIKGNRASVKPWVQFNLAARRLLAKRSW